MGDVDVKILVVFDIGNGGAIKGMGKVEGEAVVPEKGDVITHESEG